jgi:hypothetical protein
MALAQVVPDQQQGAGQQGQQPQGSYEMKFRHQATLRT